MKQEFNPQNRDLMVNINGQLVHRDQAAISPFDSVVQGGDAVWEGLRLYNGKIFKLHEHLERLRDSALALAFAEIPSRDTIIEEIKRTADIFRGRILDVTDKSYTIELTGTTEKLDAFLDALDRGAILETVRTGVSGIGRGEWVLKV